MTIEDKLKKLILARYRSIREFTLVIDMPYSTLDSIFRRGIGNSSVTNVIKICKALEISADALAEGEIISASEYDRSRPIHTREIREILVQTQTRLAYLDNPTIEGEPIDPATVEAISQGIDVSYETIRQYAQKRNKNVNKNVNKNRP